ncbi:ABC transporter permease subunit [Phyllobacterium sp. YR531]|uniref:amino acid ABC transporter permease n=1 Tax=Phyllobacterium sp. YR531 TaxID=1144343 RepID=UPI0012F6DE17|nr:ABC transporter permease subunit [Phyllobacterium sp. YR531]
MSVSGITSKPLPIPGSPKPGIGYFIREWWGSYPITQLAVLIGLIGIFWLMGSNMVHTMHRLGIQPGFAFLSQSANFAIGESLIAYSPSDTFGRAAFVGLLNTGAIAVSGCILATLLGVSLGIARLSGNMLLSGLVRWYIEIIRNTPLLLQLFFWSAVTHALPPPRQAFNPLGILYLSNRGVSIPAFRLHELSLVTLAILVVCIAALFAFYKVRSKRSVRHGIIEFSAMGLLAVLGFGLAFRLSGASVALELPLLRGFNIAGGFNLTPEFAALLIGLVVNSSATIAEIIRSGIQSVPSGQWESARSLGLQPGRIMRLVILPQALRVIVPLMTSSYLDLTKNSSLAVAIGFPDLVSVLNTTANQSGQALEALAIIVVSYLAINLSVSTIMNKYNKRIEQRGFLPR